MKISNYLKLYKCTEDIRYIISKYPNSKELKDTHKALRNLESKLHKLLSINNDLNRANNDKLEEAEI